MLTWILLPPGCFLDDYCEVEPVLDDVELWRVRPGIDFGYYNRPEHVRGVQLGDLSDSACDARQGIH